jgi:hypothetical protein
MAFFISRSNFMRQGIHYVKFIKRTKIANFLSNQANLMKVINED